MVNMYQHGTKLSRQNCTNSDIPHVPFWNNDLAMKNFLREMRKSANLTQEQLAEMVGTTHPTVQRHENSKRKLTHEWITRYANALNCHPSDITDGPGTIMAATNEQEKSLLHMLRKMSEKDQDRFLNMAEAFMEPQEKARKK